MPRGACARPKKPCHSLVELRRVKGTLPPQGRLPRGRQWCGMLLREQSSRSGGSTAAMMPPIPTHIMGIQEDILRPVNSAAGGVVQGGPSAVRGGAGGGQRTRGRVSGAEGRTTTGRTFIFNSKCTLHSLAGLSHALSKCSLYSVAGLSHALLGAVGHELAHGLGTVHVGGAIASSSGSSRTGAPAALALL